ncbi:hypothetical protein B0H14DRAFT_3876830 [Mycena olivaceomarginata]|nr:hypothetical protein B0H14DRAFT_3876830 [Mycena olivaceomarginata]
MVYAVSHIVICAFSWLVLAGGIFVSVTNIVDNTSASGGSPPCTPPNLHINDEFTSDPRPQLAKHAGAFFPSAQDLIIGAGTFISITNIIQDLTTVFTRASAEFRPGLLGDQQLYGAFGCLRYERKIAESKETPQAGEIEVEGQIPDNTLHKSSLVNILQSAPECRFSIGSP